MNGKSKSELAEKGMVLAQIGQAYVHAVVDKGGTDEDAQSIISNRRLAENLALVTLNRVSIILKQEPVVVNYCRSISSGKKIIIGATNGRAMIAEAKDTFPGFIDPDFVNYKTNVPGQPTRKMRVEVLELVRNGTFSQIYDGFGRPRESLCLTQSQIIRFAKDHKPWLRKDGYATFFLFKEKVDGKDEFFVAGVDWCEGGLEALVRRLSLDRVWSAECQRRIVVPQL